MDLPTIDQQGDRARFFYPDRTGTTQYTRETSGFRVTEEDARLDDEVPDEMLWEP